MRVGCAATCPRVQNNSSNKKRVGQSFLPDNQTDKKFRLREKNRTDWLESAAPRSLTFAFGRLFCLGHGRAGILLSAVTFFRMSDPQITKCPNVYFRYFNNVSNFDARVRRSISWNSLTIIWSSLKLRILYFKLPIILAENLVLFKMITFSTEHHYIENSFRLNTSLNCLS